MPTVSVIVPNYNHAPYLQQRIESILNQTYQDFELILLDDCSTDNSREILERYRAHPKVAHLVFNDENSGSTFRQWDKGIRLATGDYIWIAESDDWAESEFLKTMMDAAEKHPDAGLFFTASQLVDGNNTVTYRNDAGNSGEVILHHGKTIIRKQFALFNTIWNASMMVFQKKYYPEKSIRLFADMHYCGDWFFYVLLAEQTDVVEIKRTLNYFRIHPQNVSTQAEQSGMSFTEGLVIYDYINTRYLTVADQWKTAFAWGKRLYKFRQKYQLSGNRLSEIQQSVKQHNRLIYGGYCLYHLLKSI
jgi:glycosyltransferase involved in cell wall biosynthesis